MVIGGGIAGTTAALALADAGVRTTLLEARPRLGGLAFSLERDGLPADNGQHVFMRCCTAYRRLLRRLDAERLTRLQPRLDVPVLDASRPGAPRTGRLRRVAAPAPLHLAPALAGYPHLSPVERAGAVRAALAMRRLDPGDPALDRQTFADWLRRQGQSPRAVAALWDLVGVATLNAPAERASLALAVKVFRTGLLGRADAADIGIATAPLGAIHHDAAGQALRRAGVEVLLRTPARGIRPADPAGAGAAGAAEALAAPALPGGGPGDPSRHLVLLDDRALEADVVVLAVPPERAAALLPPGALVEPERLRAFRPAPIVNLHVRYDRPVLDLPMFAALGTRVQWVFNRTRLAAAGGRGTAAGADDGGQYLAVSQSAATEDVDLPLRELRERYLPELARLLPRARAARVTDFFVTRERAATFAPDLGVARLRPPARTRVPGLLLAGAWTATGWPATMEGAARSGEAAAGAALDALDRRGGQWRPSIDRKVAA
ncbi:hydroxysqualene dehydroxylase HpnE [Allostreptomyces psammosilenae]|uniref:hydroxysqualene dehydroxylase HpnE n=1 Tax=Allostreptomyces psammosilenae TaxID=1892865 RepID=UPI0028AA4074|nr:hydroxysqualene dehydroxylase HpnE [Allostreptomyces psammosilenae]